MFTIDELVTELRRERCGEIAGQIQSTDPSQERARLEKAHGPVWDTGEVSRDFEILDFSAPFVVVRRKVDGALGSLEFQPHPRFYFNFVIDTH